MKDIGAVDKKMIVAFNKIDNLDKAPDWVDYWRNVPFGADACTAVSAEGALKMSHQSRSCIISAKTGYGLDGLLRELEDLIREEYIRLDVLIPYNEGRVRSYLHENASILDEEYTDAGISMKVMLGKGHAGWLRRFAV